MNVLILTPDRVGSTLLQRLITIYMQFHEFDQPVINLHELTNGITKYYNPVFNAEVLGKSIEKGQYGYFQTLQEVTTLLDSVDHYKTSRLALYHIRNRADSMEQQVPFYQYLNDNFFIISARRQNLFEHALSWCIVVKTKQLNVYSHDQKFSTLHDLYRHGIQVERTNLFKYLDAYRDYLDWCDRHFHVNSYFEYDTHMKNLEKYILNLDIFHNQTQKLSWNQMFDIEFQDWNRCHYLVSDMSGVGLRLEQDQTLLLPGPKSDSLLPSPPTSVREVVANLSSRDQVFLRDNALTYKKSQRALEELVEHKVLVSNVPIKLQTMLEKKLLTQNFSQAVCWYNEWVESRGLGEPYTEQQLLAHSEQEIQQFHDVPLLKHTATQTPDLDVTTPPAAV